MPTPPDPPADGPQQQGPSGPLSGQQGPIWPPPPPPPGSIWPPPPAGSTWAPPPPPPPPPGGAWPPPPPAGWPGWSGYLPPLPKAGNARTGPLPLHPMTVGDILDGAVKLYRANARTLLTITALFVVPVELVSAFLSRHLLAGRGLISLVNNPTAARAAADANRPNYVVTLLSLGVTVLVLPFVAGAVSRVVAASYLGDQLEPGPALRAVAGRAWGLVVAWLCVHLLELVGLVLCIFPGLIVQAMFVMVAPVIVTEELGPFAGMRRSRRLATPRLFAVMGRTLTAGLVAGVIGVILGVVPQVVALGIGLRWGWLVLAAGNIGVRLVTVPFVAITATLIYFDARIRQEGLDLELMAAGLDRGGTTP